jgi:hypothetical protein
MIHLFSMVKLGQVAQHPNFEHAYQGDKVELKVNYGHFSYQETVYY